GAFHLDSVCEKKVPLELPRSDAAMQILPARIVLLLAANEQLVVFLHDLELVLGETRNCDRNHEALTAVALDGAFYVIGRITVRGATEPVDAFLVGIEAQEERGR